MNKILLIILLALLTYSQTYSQSKTDDIKELFKLMQTEQIIDHSMTNMANAIQQQVKGQIPDENKFKEYMGYVMSEAGKVTKQMVYSDMVNIYDKNFSQQEIKDYISFYKTPSGQKMITMQPIVQKEFIQVMSNEYMPELQAKFKAKLAEMNQK